MIRPWIIGLLTSAFASMALAQDALDQQQPVVPASAVPATLPGSAWLDLRQNVSANSVQAAPGWVESVTLIPQPAQGDTAASTIFRIRVKNPSTNYNVLFFRLFFLDRTSAQPRLVAWDELGSQVLQSGALGGGIGLDSSDAVMIPMHGVSCVDVQVAGDGTTVRGAYLDWMVSSELVHPIGSGAQDAVPQPFASTNTLHPAAQDSEQFGAVNAPLAADAMKIGTTPETAAVFDFGIEAQPLLALLTFEIAAPQIESPPIVTVNGQDAGAVAVTLPDLADPGYRGVTQRLVNGMQFQYTGWLRAQKVIPASALRAGNNTITIQNGPNASASVIRTTQIQLKYLWDKSDYILKPDH